MAKRKGATSRDAVDPQVLDQLNAGTLETATLSEGLVIDYAVLLRHAIPTLKTDALQVMDEAKTLGITKRMALAAQIALTHLGRGAVQQLQAHPSDTVRGWVAYIIGMDEHRSLAEKLQEIRPLADDAHYSVREWAWLAVRDAIVDDVEGAIALLTPWTVADSENIRRFAIESTRPRGVWSRHIHELKASPELGRSLLEAVMDDTSKYVRDACGNWLNDAAKSDPDWVRGFCDQWQGQSASVHTAYIIKRGLRSIA